MAVTRRNLIGLAVADVALFVIANAAYNHHGLLRAISNIAWVAFLIGVVLLIVLGVRALVQSRRAR
jgi:hypothetical protein